MQKKKEWGSLEASGTYGANGCKKNICEIPGMF